MAGVYLSYRRTGSSMWAAERLADRLREDLGKRVKVTSVDRLVPAAALPDAVRRTLGDCRVVVAVIGEDWLEAEEFLEGIADIRRLDDEDDAVRLEITTALELGLQLVPVLLDGVAMPASTDLPESLRPLVRRHSVALSAARFDADSRKLAERLQTLLGVAPVKRRRRRRRLAIGGGVIVLLGIGFAILRAGDGGSARLPPGVVAAAELDPVPTAIGVGDGAVWVAKKFDDEVLRFDPDTLDVVATIAVGSDPMAVAVSPGAIWVANGSDGTVSRIDPDSNTVVETIIVGFPFQSQVAFFDARLSLAATDDALWMSGEGIEGLRRIDLDTNQQSTVPLPDGMSPWALDAAGDSLWVTDDSAGTLARVDADTGEVVAVIELERTGRRVAASVNAVWVTSDNNILIRVDPVEERVADVVGVPGASVVSDLAAWDNGLWVIDTEGAVVYFSLQGSPGRYITGTIDLPRDRGSDIVDAAPDIAAGTPKSAWAITERGLLVRLEELMP